MILLIYKIGAKSLLVKLWLYWS